MGKTPGNRGLATRLWRWVKNQFISDVPQDIELCEYDCRKGQCTLSEWEKCEKRLSKAAGELWPNRSDSEEPQSKV